MAKPFRLTSIEEMFIVERALTMAASFDENIPRGKRANELADAIRQHVTDPQPEPQQLYLELYHGDADPLKLSPEDEGLAGPIFGPYDFVHIVPTGFMLQRTQGEEHNLTYTQDVQFYYDGIHYGCAEITTQPERNRIRPFQSELAKVPWRHDPSAGLDRPKGPSGITRITK